MGFEFNKFHLWVKCVTLTKCKIVKNVIKKKVINGVLEVEPFILEPLVLATLQCYYEDNEEKNTKFFENACFKEHSGSKNALGNVECA